MDKRPNENPKAAQQVAVEATVERVKPEYNLTRQARWREISWYKIPLFFTSLFLFILAITLMKEGARALIPLVQTSFAITNPVNSLGFGWAFAYLIMSGSPVAAAALTFFDAGVVTDLGAFTMITGSRLGASFIVLFIGFIYVLRGRNRGTSLDMGLLSLTVTATTHVPALFLGMYLLQTGTLESVHPSSGSLLTALTDYIFDPLVALFVAYLPRIALFIIGFVIIMVSFSLFDRCLPQMTLKESQVGRMSRLVYRPSIMFLLGGGITLISMSVSVSLSLLVPLSTRGFVRRENVIPYIMGAGVTTFIDTLFAAMLMSNTQAFTIVLVEMVTVTVVSLLILLTVYRRYERYTLAFVNWTTSSNRNLAIFMLIILIVPIILMFF